jgi:hypothetical protein
MSRAKDRCIFVQDDRDGNAGKDFCHRPLIGKGLAEVTFFQLGKYLHSDASREENSPIRENAQRQVSSFCAKRIDPPIENLNTNRAAASESIAGDFTGRNRGRFAKSGMSFRGIEKLVQFAEAPPGKDIFAGYAGKVLLESQKETGFSLIAGSKIRRATLGGSRAMALAIPIEDCFTQAGSGRDYRLVTSRVGDALVQWQEITRREFVQAERCGDKIVQQDYVFDGKIHCRSKSERLYGPGQIKGIKTPVHHCSGYSKTCGPNLIVGGSL